MGVWGLVAVLYFVASLFYMAFNIDDYCESEMNGDSYISVFIFAILLMLILNPFYIFPIRFCKTIAKGGILAKTLTIAKEVVRNVKDSLRI